MRIALIAHDSRKELMAQFCTAYVRILSENELVATGVTGKIVHDATPLMTWLAAITLSWKISP